MAMCMVRVGIITEGSTQLFNLLSVSGMVRSWSAALVLGTSVGAFAQTAAPDSSVRSDAVRFSGFVDVYYAYDLGHPTDDERPNFLYQYDRHNEVDLNLGLVRADYVRHRVRGSFGLMAGTYAQANLIGEPALLRNVYEARVGMKLSRTRELWLDAGIFPSHIGLESAIGLDNWTLTRSVVAENSPYYLSGAKLTWTTSSELEVAALFMNGWQRLRRVQNEIPCFGTQVLWKPRDSMKLNWSTFLGSDTPDSLGHYRIFNNLWWSLEGPKWGLQLGADAGVQENVRGSWNDWVGCVGIVRRKWSGGLSAMARAEYYSDDHQVIIFTGTPHGLTTVGYSIGLDLAIGTDAFIRIEGRTFHGVDAIFESVHGPVRDNTSFTVSMAARF